jgi:hypothetical protein
VGVGVGVVEVVGVERVEVVVGVVVGVVEVGVEGM